MKFLEDGIKTLYGDEIFRGWNENFKVQDENFKGG